MRLNLAPWIRYRWLWFIPLTVSLLLICLWVALAWPEEQYAITHVTDLEGLNGKKQRVYVQYPRELSTDNTGRNSQQMSIFVTSDDDAYSVLTFRFSSIPGVINYVDKDGMRVSNIVRVPTGVSTTPTNLWMEHANTSLLSSQQTLRVETSLLITDSTQPSYVRVPDLDLIVELESPWRYTTRSVLRGATGVLAPASLIATLLVFSGKTFLDHKKIRPRYIDLQLLMDSARWDKAAMKAREILEIDPMYDSVQRMYIDISGRLDAQERMLEDMYVRGRSCYQARNWSAATELFQRIHEMRPDYKDVSTLLAEVNGRLDQAREIAALYQQATSLELSGDFGQAVVALRKIVAIDANYMDAQARLTNSERWLFVHARTDPSVMRAIVMLPALGFSWTASLIEQAAESNPELVSILVTDENPAVRGNVARLARRTTSRELRNRLVSRLVDDRDEQVRELAREAMVQDGDLARLLQLLADPDLWPEAGEALALTGERAVGPLIQLLNAEWPIHSRAANVLARMGDIGKLALVRATERENPTVRDRARLALATLELEDEWNGEPEGN